MNSDKALEVLKAIVIEYVNQCRVFGTTSEVINKFNGIQEALNVLEGAISNGDGSDDNSA